jgi:hypothetical protein
VSDDGGSNSPLNGFSGGSSGGWGCATVGLRSSDVGLNSGLGLLIAFASWRRRSERTK